MEFPVDLNLKEKSFVLGFYDCNLPPEPTPLSREGYNVGREIRKFYDFMRTAAKGVHEGKIYIPPVDEEGRLVDDSGTLLARMDQFIENNKERYSIKLTHCEPRGVANALNVATENAMSFGSRSPDHRRLTNGVPPTAVRILKFTHDA